MMSQSAGQKAVPPSVGADVSAIKALLSRNLPEVFGEGDPARRRVAIQQLYNNALEQIRRRSSSDASPLCLYASWRAPGSAQFRAPLIARDGKIAALYVYLDSPPT